MTQIESATMMLMLRGQGEAVLGQGEVAVDSVVSVWFTALTACGTNTANSGSYAGGDGEVGEKGERGKESSQLVRRQR